MVFDRPRNPSLLRAMLLFALVTLASQACADQLERIVAVAKGGATDLALRLLAQHQPPPTQSQEWMRWETERLAILAQVQEWKQIAARVEQLPPDLPMPFVRWALGQAADAQLAAEAGAAARKYLRRLLWTAVPEPGQLEQWRRMVIRSYLLDDNVADAHTALLRYKQDYRANNEAWKLLHAKVLLRAGRNKTALDVLQGTQSLEGKILRALAGMRSGIHKAPAAKAQGLKLVEAAKDKPELQQKAWALVAEAALKAGAKAVIDGAAPDAVQQIIAATGGGAWAVIDLVGSSQTARLGIDSLIKGGKFIIVGLYGGDLTVSLPPFPMRAITVQGSYVGSLTETAELIDLVRRTGVTYEIVRDPDGAAYAAFKALYLPEIGRAHV